MKKINYLLASSLSLFVFSLSAQSSDFDVSKVPSRSSSFTKYSQELINSASKSDDDNDPQRSFLELAKKEAVQDDCFFNIKESFDPRDSLSLVLNRLAGHITSKEFLQHANQLPEEDKFPEMMYFIGKAHYDLKEYIEAFDCFMKSKSLAQSLYRVGIFYEAGVDGLMDKNLESARDFYEQAHKMGHLGSAYRLGLIAASENDLNGAEEYYKNAALKGHQKSLYALAHVNPLDNVERFFSIMELLHERYPNNFNYARDLYVINKEFKEGAAEDILQNILSLSHKNHNHEAALFAYKELITREAHKAQALMLLQKAADFGNGEALNILGFMYKEGRHVMRDLDHAMDLFAKSVFMGYVKSLYDLGNIKREIGNDIEARKYMEESAQSGDERGLKALAKMYMDGVGADADPFNALTLYKSCKSLSEEESQAATKLERFKRIVLSEDAYKVVKAQYDILKTAHKTYALIDLYLSFVKEALSDYDVRQVSQALGFAVASYNIKNMSKNSAAYLKTLDLFINEPYYNFNKTHDKAIRDFLDKMPSMEATLFDAMESGLFDSVILDESGKKEEGAADEATLFDAMESGLFDSAILDWSGKKEEASNWDESLFDSISSGLFSSVFLDESGKKEEANTDETNPFDPMSSTLFE